MDPIFPDVLLENREEQQLLQPPRDEGMDGGEDRMEQEVDQHHVEQVRDLQHMMQRIGHGPQGPPMGQGNQNLVERAAARAANGIEPLEAPAGRQRFFEDAPEINTDRYVAGWVEQAIGEYPRRAPFNAAADTLGLAFRCTGGPPEQPCTVVGTPVGTMYPDAPPVVRQFRINTVYDFVRASSILLCSHKPPMAVVASLMDQSYDLVNQEGWIAGLSAFKTRCLHVVLALEADLHNPGVESPLHLPRGENDPYVLSTMRSAAVFAAQRSGWEDGSHAGRRLKTLVVAPKSFAAFTREWSFDSTVVLAIETDEEYEAVNNFNEYGALVIITPTQFTTIARRGPFYQMVFRALARGVEVYLLSGPRDNLGWSRNQDQAMDVYETAVALVPQWRSRIRCLLPTHVNLLHEGAPWVVPPHPQVDVRPQLLSATWVHRYWKASGTYFAPHIVLELPKKRHTRRGEEDVIGMGQLQQLLMNNRGLLNGILNGRGRGGRGGHRGHAVRGHVAPGARGGVTARGNVGNRGHRGGPNQRGNRGRGAQHHAGRGAPNRGHGRGRRGGFRGAY